MAKGELQNKSFYTDTHTNERERERWGEGEAEIERHARVRRGNNDVPTSLLSLLKFHC